MAGMAWSERGECFAGLLSGGCLVLLGVAEALVAQEDLHQSIVAAERVKQQGILADGQRQKRFQRPCTGLSQLSDAFITILTFLT